MMLCFDSPVFIKIASQKTEEIADAKGTLTWYGDRKAQVKKKKSLLELTWRKKAENKWIYTFLTWQMGKEANIANNLFKIFW